VHGARQGGAATAGSGLPGDLPHTSWGVPVLRWVLLFHVRVLLDAPLPSCITELFWSSTMNPPAVELPTHAERGGMPCLRGGGAAETLDRHADDEPSLGLWCAE